MPSSSRSSRSRRRSLPGVGTMVITTVALMILSPPSVLGLVRYDATGVMDDASLEAGRGDDEDRGAGLVADQHHRGPPTFAFSGVVVGGDDEDDGSAAYANSTATWTWPWPFSRRSSHDVEDYEDEDEDDDPDSPCARVSSTSAAAEDRHLVGGARGRTWSRVLRMIHAASRTTSTERTPLSMARDPLRCWLWRLRVDVPDQSFREGIFRVSSKNMVCTNFEVGSVSSSYNAPSGRTIEAGLDGGSVTVTTSGISATCTGQYSAAGTGGSIRATVDHGSKLTVTVAVHPDGRHYMAKSATISHCEADLRIPKDSLVFSGSFSSRFANLFAGPIAGYVSNALSTSVCPAVSSAVGPKLTDALAKANAVLTDVIRGGRPATDDPPIPLSYRGKSLDWTSGDDVPLLRRGLVGLNDVLARQFGSGWTCLVRGVVDLATNGTGAVRVGLDPSRFSWNVTVPGYGVIELGLTQANLTGLHNLDDMVVLNPSDRHAVNSSIAFDGSAGGGAEGTGLTASASVNLRVYPTGGAKGDTLEESFSIKVAASDINVSTRAFVGVDRDAFNALTVDAAASPCILETIFLANLTDVSAVVNVSSVHLSPATADLTARGDVLDGGAELISTLEEALDELIDNILDLFVKEYRHLVTDATYGFVQGPLRSTVNSILEKIFHADYATLSPPSVSEYQVSRRASSCESPTPRDMRSDDSSAVSSPDYIKFDESPVIAWIDSLLNGGLGLGTLNNIMHCSADFLLKHDTFSGVIYSFERDGLKLDVSNVELENLASFYELGVIEPEIDHYHLNNKLAFGQCHVDNGIVQQGAGDPLVATVALDVEYAALGLHGQSNVTLHLGNASVQGGADIEFDVNKFGALTLYQLLGRSQCIVEPLSFFQLYNVATGLGFVGLDINATVAWDGKETKAVNFTLGEEAVASVNSAMERAIPLLEQTLNAAANVTLHRGPFLCRGEDVPPEPRGAANSHAQDWVFWKSFAFVTVAGMVGVLTFFLVRRHTKRFSYNSLSSVEELIVEDKAREPLLPQDTYLDQDSVPNENAAFISSRNTPYSALMFHKSRSQWLQYFVPVILVCTMALFFSSNISVGASVDPVISSQGGASVHLPPVFAFSLGNTVSEMYHAGVYALMLLIVVFSGIWPYVKLALMLFAWVAPSERFSPARREQLLIWLDALGKYSLVDTYVLVLMMVAFRFHLEILGYTIDVFVTPMYGFYGFLVATIASLVMGHVVLFLHRRSTEKKEFPRIGRQESLRDHVYGFASDRGGWVLTKSAQILIGIALVASATLLTIGIGVKSFDFEIKGLAGLALGETRKSSYSFFSLGKSIPFSVENPNGFWIRLFQFFFYFFGIITPLMCLLTLAILFFSPMGARCQKRWFFLAEVCNAWSSMEVFLLSIVAALLQISRFSAFMVGDNCDTINKVLSAWLDHELEGHDVCFDVSASVSAGSTYLFVGTVANCLVTFLLLRLAHQALDERLEREGEASNNHGLGEETADILDQQRTKSFAESINACFCGRLFLASTEGYVEYRRIEDEPSIDTSKDVNAE